MKLKQGTRTDPNLIIKSINFNQLILINSTINIVPDQSVIAWSHLVTFGIFWSHLGFLIPSQWYTYFGWAQKSSFMTQFLLAILYEKVMLFVKKTQSSVFVVLKFFGLSFPS